MTTSTSRYGWVIVAAGAVITCVAMGAMFALPVYLQPMAQETGWSHAGISFAMTIGFIVMGIGGFLWGTLSDKVGPRPAELGTHDEDRLNFRRSGAVDYWDGEK